MSRPESVSVYLGLAETLEKTARLSEEHAERARSRQQFDLAAIETERADRARRAALRARELASRQRPETDQPPSACP